MDRLCPECMECVLEHNLKKYPEGTSRQNKIKYLRRLMKIIADAKSSEGSPVMARDITRLQEEMFGISNEYAEIKIHFNNMMLSYEQDIKTKIEAARDPLRLAIGYSLAGNYIDFGAMKSVDEEVLKKMLGEAPDIELDAGQYGPLKEDLKKAGRLVYLTDNCGEVVMDKLLIETILKMYPDIQITVIVRGGDALNDATMEDAIQVGLLDVARVVGNGNRIAGTSLAEMSQESRQIFDAADIIISKGQGNFETLRMCGANIYYLFLCKCSMFAGIFDVPKFTGILVNEKCLTKEEKD